MKRKASATDGEGKRGAKTGMASSFSSFADAEGRWKADAAVKLNNGVEMPIFGLGMSHNGGGDYVKGIQCSLANGVRHFDTAARYKTERILGETLKPYLENKKSVVIVFWFVRMEEKEDRQRYRVKRSDLFITTKLWPGDAEDVKGAFQSSSEALDLGVDLYLLHWPGVGGKERRKEVWREMELLLENGKVRAIGVSNFIERHLVELEETASVVPAVNQIEANPFQYRKSLVKVCHEMGIQVEGYCPLAKGRVVQSPELAAIAKTQGCTSAQLALRWSLQRNIITIPKSCSESHIKSNVEALTMNPIPGKVMEQIDALDCNLRCTWDPTNVK